MKPALEYSTSAEAYAAYEAAYELATADELVELTPEQAEALDWLDQERLRLMDEYFILRRREHENLTDQELASAILVAQELVDTLRPKPHTPRAECKAWRKADAEHLSLVAIRNSRRNAHKH